MTGLLALLGGQEHTPGCEDIDRRLLEESASAKPLVTVVLAATTPRRRAFKINEATTYWHGLGVDVNFALTGGPGETDRALAALEDSDLVVLTGGHPWLLHTRLDGSPVLQRILELRDQGVPLSGSSAGAIAMCEWRQLLQPPRPFQLVRGALGLVGGSAAAPHWDRYGLNRWAELVGRRYPKLRILGLSDRTALVGRNGEFTVYGSGSVALLQGRTVTRVPRSGSLELTLATPLA